MKEPEELEIGTLAVGNEELPTPDVAHYQIDERLGVRVNMQGLVYKCENCDPARMALVSIGIRNEEGHVNVAYLLHDEVTRLVEILGTVRDIRDTVVPAEGE